MRRAASSSVLGMDAITFVEGRKALRFGGQKLNLHQSEGEFETKAAAPSSGSVDLCFLLEGPLKSIYIRDPDGNLLELSVQQRGDFPR